jgi:LysM repeat protein
MGAAAALGAGALFLRGGARPADAAVNHHLIWVWQFSTDGEPNVLGAKLRDHGLGIILKTHDGVTWMSEYDTSKYAISGPAQLQVVAKYFEDAGVPFHVWCVLHGTDPIKEAQMAAATALSGARSIFIDVEPHSGFWRGTPLQATQFGQEFRRLAPDAKVVLSIDPRPWMVPRLPMKEFAAFSDAIAPQEYWHTFDTQANYDRFRESNLPVQGNITPEFLLAVSYATLSQYGKPIIHTGQGDTQNWPEWMRYINAAYAAGSDFVTVWRYGVTPDDIFKTLRDIPAKQPPVAAPALISGAVEGNYTVQAGDTLGSIAATYGTSVQAIMDASGLTDPNYIYVGQQLVVPGAGGVVQAASAPAADAGAAPAGGGGSGGTYVVQSGDTLGSIAAAHGTTVDALVAANGLSDPNYLYIGQELVIA